MRHSIRDFIGDWKLRDRNNGNRNVDGNVPQWHIRFREAGYHRAVPGRDGVGEHWQEMHQWCEQQYGQDHYSWTGSTFWFETEQAAALFILRWA